MTKTEERTTQPTTRPPNRRAWRGPVVAAAVFVVVIVIGAAGVLIANRDDGTEPANTTTTTTATTTTTVAPVDTAALAAIGDQLMAAFDSGDADTVAELIADDAEPIAMFGASTKSEVLALFGWIDATDVRLRTLLCKGSEPDQVECSVMQSTRWASAAGASAQEGTMLLKIEDGQVIAMRYGRPGGLGSFYEDFRRFVREADPTAPEKMWFFDSAQEPYPILTEEAYSLFEQYTEEYWDWLRN